MNNKYNLKGYERIVYGFAKSLGIAILSIAVIFIGIFKAIIKGNKNGIN